jgi:UDP-N-acetylglucosamine:LPS N-acetylglucosamine transferase
LIVTASMGAGHTEVADELARRLIGQGADTEVIDVLALAGRAGSRLRTTYRFLLAWAPWLYDAAMRVWARCPPLLERVARVGSGAAERALADAVRDRQPDVVVSTYNLAAQTLGRLAARGDCRAPVVTVVTDPGAHPYWVSPDVALHIAPLELTAARLSSFGARRVVVAPPLLRPQMRSAPAQAEARETLGLPDQPTALVTAGSWAVGRVQRTVAALRGAQGVFVVVLCGRDERLRAQLSDRPGVHAVPWTNKVPAYLAAADVVVDNAGGLTCWEALACGRPVVIFDPLPGHGRFNAAALAEAGLVRWARTPAELCAAVRAPAAPGRLASGPGAEQYVLEIARSHAFA